jgi:hypothetical protein
MNNAENDAEAFEGRLRRALNDPPPADLNDQLSDLFTWRTIDAELAELVDAAAIDAELAGVRGDDVVTTLSFQCGDIMIELEDHGASGPLEGQVLPPQSATVVFISPSGGERSVTTSSQGLFQFVDAPSGPFRLVITLTVGRRVHTAWTTR